MPNKYWTEEDRAELVRTYSDTPTDDIAKKLGRSRISVYSLAKKMGLRKSDEYLKSPVALALFNSVENNKANRFKIGNVPWNKNLKGTELSQGFRNTQYKAGNKPSSWKPIGTTRSFNGYIKIKVADTGVTSVDWSYHHVELWKQHHGELPQKHVVIFFDSDKTNFDISNLVCLHRAEVFWLNKNGWSTTPIELRHAMIALARLECAKFTAIKKLKKRK